MPTFVWTCKDSAGRALVREVHAETAREAREALAREGCTDLVLKEDEIAAAAREAMAGNTSFLGREIHVTAADRVKHRNKPPATFPRALLESIPQGRLLYPLLLAMLAICIYRGQTVGAILVGAAMVAWPVFVTWVRLPSIYFAQLHKASDWHRWDDLLSIVDKLERLNRIHFIKIPASELARNRARSMIGHGQLTEAFEYFRQFENQPGCPGWLYKAQVAGLYDTAKQFDKGIEWTRMAIAEKPSTALNIDLLSRLVCHTRDTAAARAVLAQIDHETIPDLGRPFVARSRGILAYLESDNATARAELESSLEALEKARNQPFRDGSRALAKAYLCCVLARQGEMPAARKYLADAREYLTAAGENDLLAECERMVG